MNRRNFIKAIASGIAALALSKMGIPASDPEYTKARDIQQPKGEEFPYPKTREYLLSLGCPFEVNIETRCGKLTYEALKHAKDTLMHRTNAEGEPIHLGEVWYSNDDPANWG
jgi:hypothetical protein